MAHRITYKPQGIIFSSALESIPIETDAAFVDVELSAPHGRILLAERYYPYNGKVELYELNLLIEAEMRKSALTYADFTLKVFNNNGTTDTPDPDDTCLLHILYCDRLTLCNATSDFLRENFLSTLSVRRVAPASTLSLSFFAEVGESLAYSVAYTCRLRDTQQIIRDTFSINSDATSQASDTVQLNIPLSSILEHAAAEADLLSFSVRCGARSVTCFVDTSLSTADEFYFRNCFNILDTAALPPLTTAKTDVDRSLAIINGKSRLYNRLTTKTFEVQFGPLTSDEAKWIDQLFSSHEVYRIESVPTDTDDPLRLVPVLITESTCETTDDDDKLNTVKFTWQFTDTRPLIPLSASPGTFSSQFNLVYS